MVLQIFEVLQEVGIDAQSYSEIMREFVNVFKPTRVSIEALKVLARTKTPKVATLLLRTFDNASGSQKREIIKMLLLHYDDVPTLRNVVEKLIAFYRESALQFDLFDAFMTEVSPIARLQLLKGDPATIRALTQVSCGSQLPVELKRFARALLAVID